MLCGLGFILSDVFGCVGSWRIETCATPGAFKYVAPLLVMGWVSIFTVPIGVVLLIVIVLIRWWMNRRAEGKA